MENSPGDENTRPPDLPPKKPVSRSRSNSENQTCNKELVPNWERSTSRLHIVTCLFNLYAEYIMRNAGLDEAQAGMKIARRNIISITSDMQMTLPYGGKQRTKEPLDESERGK